MATSTINVPSKSTVRSTSRRDFDDEYEKLVVFNGIGNTPVADTYAVKVVAA